MTTTRRRRIGIAVSTTALVATAALPQHAAADHGTGPERTDPKYGYHEEMPDFAEVAQVVPCTVLGTVLAGPPAENDQHQYPVIGDPEPWGIRDLRWRDPAHSHFAFVESVAVCPPALGAFGFTADGGNDGHSADVHDGWEPGGNGDLVEDDPVDCLFDPLDVENVSDGCVGGPNNATPGDGDDHDYGLGTAGDAHHGSVGESAWSHSSSYSGGRDDSLAPNGESNDGFDGPPFDHAGACWQNGSDPATGMPSHWNQNRADITAVGVAGPNQGWVKYHRLADIVFVWGCFWSGAALAQTYFSGSLTLLITDPTAFLNDLPQPYLAVGTIWLAPDWLVDSNAVDAY